MFFGLRFPTSVEVNELFTALTDYFKTFNSSCLSRHSVPVALDNG